jgi:hypothetical protein
MTALLEHRTRLIVVVAFVIAVAIFAAVDQGAVQASAFLPVFVGIWLLERKKRTA